MKMVSYFARGAGASALILAGSVASASAQDIDAALERLQQVLAEQEINIEWAEAEIDGNDVVLRGVTAGPDDEMVPIGDFFLTGISETDRGYRIEEVSMPEYTFTDEQGTVTVEDVVLRGVALPDEGAEDPYGGFFFYDSAEMARLSFATDATEVFVLNNLNIEVTPAENGQPLTFAGVAEEFNMDLSTVDDEEARQIIQQMDFEQLSGSFETAGSWQPEDGTVTIDRYDLTVVDAGTLGFSVELGGYTREFIETLRQTQAAMAEADDNGGSGMAMLGLLQQLDLHGIDIYFHDDSLTDKILEVVAAQQGLQPSDVVNQANALLPLMLAQLNAPELATMVREAVAEYLGDPRSIRISARPPEPFPFAMLMAAAMAPQMLVQQAGLEIVANE